MKSNSQTFLQRFFDRFQRLFNFLWLTEGTRIDGSDFTKRMSTEGRLRNVSFEQATLDYISGIEVRAGALLQHVSMMIALTGVYFVLSDGSPFLHLILSLEIFGYLWTALCCLRCIMHVSTNDLRGFSDKDVREIYELEGEKRELIYRHALQALVFLTVTLGAIVLVQALFSALN